MKATKHSFKRKMEQLDVEQIVDLMRRTWNDATGPLFREIGFEIIDGRVSEEESDRIYSELYATC